MRLWRRISGSGSVVRDAVNAVQRELRGLADTGAYVSAIPPPPRVTNVLTLWFPLSAMVRDTIGKSLNVPQTSATRDVRGPVAESPEIGVA
jgi:hypothetical protein